MRPRLMSRGKEVPDGGALGHHGRFNAAAAHEPRKERGVCAGIKCVGLLQCGRGS